MPTTDCYGTIVQCSNKCIWDQNRCALSERHSGPCEFFCHPSQHEIPHAIPRAAYGYSTNRYTCRTTADQRVFRKLLHQMWRAIKYGRMEAVRMTPKDRILDHCKIRTRYAVTFDVWLDPMEFASEPRKKRRNEIDFEETG